MLNRKDLLYYEVASSWWAGLISWDWGHTLVGKYFAWKVTRKFARYERHMKVKLFLAQPEGMVYLENEKK